MKKNQKVLEETTLAYCDCARNSNWNETQHKRNLSFLASEFVSRDEAAKIMSQAVPGGYNDFRSDLLKKLPPRSKVKLAREGSVCIYVSPRLADDLRGTLKEDEFHQENGATRLWWD